MEIVDYLRLLRKWIWLILPVVLVTGIGAYVLSPEPQVGYRAETTLTIGNFFRDPNPSGSELQLGMQLAATYTQIIRTEQLLNNTIEALGIDMSASQLRQMILTYTIPNTSLMVVRVTDANADRARNFANSLADQLILASPTNLSEAEQAQIELANEQIQELNEQIRESREQLQIVTNEVLYARDADEIARMTLQRNLLIDQINQASATVAQFSNSILSTQQRTNELSVVEEAQVYPFQNGTSQSVMGLVGASAGFVLIFGVLVVYEVVNDKLSSLDKVSTNVGLPRLGVIRQYGTKEAPYPERLVYHDPKNLAAKEDFRSLRVNLKLSNNAEQTRLFVISSPGPHEGKSVIAANLAESVALAGLRVLLIDGDLRRPTVHRIFELSAEPGLTSLVSTSPPKRSMENGNHNYQRIILDQYLQTTDIPNLKIITSGFIPANPTEILGSFRIQKWIDLVTTSFNFDLIIVDTPPALLVPDSLALASRLEAEVILVVDIKQTRRGNALKVKEQFEQLGVRVRGVVVNRANASQGGYAYSYRVQKNYETGATAHEIDLTDMSEIHTDPTDIAANSQEIREAAQRRDIEV